MPPICWLKFSEKIELSCCCHVFIFVAKADKYDSEQKCVTRINKNKKSRVESKVLETCNFTGFLNDQLMTGNR